MTTDALWRTLGEYLESPELLQAPDEVVPGLAWRGRMTMFAAREKSGKSTYSAFCAAIHSKEKDSSVLWVNLEEAPYDVVMRLKGFNANVDRVRISEFLPDRADNLRGAITKNQPTLVIIDSLPAWASGKVKDLNDAAQVTPMMLELVDMVRESNCAMVLLHHSKKSDGHYRGSTAFGASVDMIIEMTESKKGSAIRDFEPQGRWAVPPYSMEHFGSSFELAFAQSRGKTSIRDQVLRHIERNPGCGINGVRTAVTGKHTKIDYAIQQLEADGVIKNRGGARQFKFFIIEDALNDLIYETTGHVTGTPSEEAGTSSEAFEGHGMDTEKGAPPCPTP